MKNLLLIALFSFLLTTNLSAQKSGTNYSQLKELKVKYFNTQLQLNNNEAIKFWEIYNQYDKERQALKQALKKGEKVENVSLMSENEINAFLNNYFDIKEKEVSVQKKYFEEFRKFLSPQQLVKLVNIEEQFRKFLFKQAQLKNNTSGSNR
ncbi:MAG: hypothetical protein M9958_04520 [Chitinophagales bacterium]|nr:hypothetical protein [Chitinophagales bacterium]